MNRRQEIWVNFISFYWRLISFYWRFIQSLSKLAGLLTLMLRTSPTRSAKNLPSSMDGAGDIKVGSRTSSTSKSAKNLPSDMGEDAKVGGNGDGGDNETVKRSPFSKKPNRLIGLICSWGNLLYLWICMLGFTIHLGLDAVMTAGSSSHKSRFIYHFIIAYYCEGLSSDRGLMEKLWC